MLYRRVATCDILPCKFGCCWPNGRGVGVRVGAGAGAMEILTNVAAPSKVA